jgi:hypothetical protein
MDETPKKHSIVRLIAWTSSVAAAIVIGVFIFQHFAKPESQRIGAKLLAPRGGTSRKDECRESDTMRP